MTDQPEALRLADRLTAPNAGPWDNYDAAAELRRLHARAEFAEQQVVQLAEERDHYRRLWQKAQQAEPVQRKPLT